MELVISSLIVVFIKLHGLSSKHSILSSRYQQVEISTHLTFDDLLYHSLGMHKADEYLSQSDVSDILGLTFNVHYQSKGNGGSQIGAQIGTSCIGLKLTGNVYVNYEFKEASPRQKGSISAIPGSSRSNLLMLAQNCRMFLNKYDKPSNFLQRESLIL
jgi:hypothetical protein